MQLGQGVGTQRVFEIPRVNCFDQLLGGLSPGLLVQLNEIDFGISFRRFFARRLEQVVQIFAVTAARLVLVGDVNHAFLTIWKLEANRESLERFRGRTKNNLCHFYTFYEEKDPFRIRSDGRRKATADCSEGAQEKRLVADDAANHGHCGIDRIDLIAVELRELGDGQIAVAIRRIPAGQHLLQGHLGQRARDGDHRLVAGL